jgi:hypothetical protein
LRDANDTSRTPGSRVEFRVTKETPHERSNLILLHSGYDQTAPRMTLPSSIEISIAAEKRHVSVRPQKCNDFVVRHALPAEIDADLLRGKARHFERLTLRGKNVLVENDQTRT